MILIDIKNYLQSQQTANLEEISRHFHCDTDTVKIMLEHWIRKGRVVRIANPAQCGQSCRQCQPKTAEVYGYVE